MPTLFADVVNQLRTKMEELVPTRLYPPHVLPIPGWINGTAFFPGGSGLYFEGHDQNEVVFPIGGVMILGHNFDSESGFTKSFQHGAESLTTGTWGPLVKLLKGASIPLEQCLSAGMR